MTATRKLAAILAADVAGYSRLVGIDEEGTIARLQALRRELIDPMIAAHRGRIVKTTGDGLLVEFASVVDAVRCAVEVQQAMAERNEPVPQDERIEFRIGINVGDIVTDGSDILGDGVNIAARLEGLAEPGGICVSARVQEDAYGKLDITFVDAGEQNLKNILRSVRVYRVRLDGRRTVAATPALPNKPSIAVLPFTNMSGDPEQEYFSDGIAEDIITMLSRSPWLFVIARNSSFTYKGRTFDVRQVSRELGVRYVLEGSVRRGGDRVRITAQLIDAETGNHVWAERYDRNPAEIFSVQDEMADAVATAIEPAVARMERGRATRKPSESLGAWEAYQRGLWHMGRIGTAEMDAAKSFFRQAIDLDPNFAPPQASLAIAILLKAWYYPTYSLSEALDEGMPVAQRAIALDPLDPVAHTSLGWGLFCQGEHDGVLAESRTALDISPNYAAAHHLLGAALTYSGRPREGLESLRKAARLDPHDPLMGLRSAHVGTALYFLREYDAAVDAAKETLRAYPDHPLIYRLLTFALGQASRLDEAKQALQKASLVAPKSFDVHVRQRPPYWRPEDFEHMLDGLRKAGWEG